MMLLRKVIVGSKPNACADVPLGVPPYSMMPGRTQSLSRWCSSKPAELHRLRGKLVPMLAAPASKRSICWASGKRVGAASSALAKCVIRVIVPICGMARRRAYAAATASGVKPRRFMPVFIFRCTSMACGKRAAASMAICSSQCTLPFKPYCAMTGKSLASKKPSSSKMGLVQPSSRKRTA